MSEQVVAPFGPTSLRLVLIGCSKTKLPYTPTRKRGGRLHPQEMYGGQLFPKRVAYAESRGLPWGVLSAEYGLWRGSDERQPYEAKMSDLSPAEFAIWHAKVAYDVIHELWEPWENELSSRVYKPQELTVEIHAGKAYAHPLSTILRSLGVVVELPCEGLGIGQQLQLYTSGALATVV